MINVYHFFTFCPSTTIAIDTGVYPCSIKSIVDLVVCHATIKRNYSVLNNRGSFNLIATRYILDIAPACIACLLFRSCLIKQCERFPRSLFTGYESHTCKCCAETKTLKKLIARLLLRQKDKLYWLMNVLTSRLSRLQGHY